MSQMIEVSIDGSTVAVDASATVLEAALEQGLFIPHLCHDPDLEPAGVCRLCLVEVDGRLVTSCNTPVTEGAEIRTDTEAVKETRLGAVELLLVNHHHGTVECEEGDACELNRIAHFTGVDEKRLDRYRRPDAVATEGHLEPVLRIRPEHLRAVRDLRSHVRRDRRDRGHRLRAARVRHDDWKRAGPAGDRFALCVLRRVRRPLPDGARSFTGGRRPRVR